MKNVIVIMVIGAMFGLGCAPQWARSCHRKAFQNKSLKTFSDCADSNGISKTDPNRVRLESWWRQKDPVFYLIEAAKMDFECDDVYEINRLSMGEGDINTRQDETYSPNSNDPIINAMFANSSSNSQRSFRFALNVCGEKKVYSCLWIQNTQSNGMFFHTSTQGLSNCQLINAK